MNPALLNYLQMQQQPSEGQQMPQEQAPYNPFDQGISKAIASARESLGMTDKQQEKALRRSMLTFGDNIAAQPRQRGFFNNFGSVARALSPAIMEHDNAEDAALTQNNALANQILTYKAAEEAKQAQLEEQAWKRQHEEAKLGEQRRYHNLLDNFKRDKSGDHGQPHGNAKGNPGDLGETFNYISKTIDKLGDKAFRGRLTRVADKYTPGGILPNKEQAQIEALNRTLKGNLFRAWGYRAAAEFKELPDISPNNPPEVNKAIIKQLKNITKVKLGQANVDDLINAEDIDDNVSQENIPDPSETTPPEQEWIMIESPSGRQEEVYFEDVPGLEEQGYRRVQ